MQSRVVSRQNSGSSVTVTVTYYYALELFRQRYMKEKQNMERILHTRSHMDIAAD